MSCRSRLATLNEKLTALERRIEYIEARVSRTALPCFPFSMLSSCYIFLFVNAGDKRRDPDLERTMDGTSCSPWICVPIHPPPRAFGLSVLDSTFPFLGGIIIRTIFISCDWPLLCCLHGRILNIKWVHLWGVADFIVIFQNKVGIIKFWFQNDIQKWTCSKL